MIVRQRPQRRQCRSYDNLRKMAEQYNAPHGAKLPHFVALAFDDGSVYADGAPPAFFHAYSVGGGEVVIYPDCAPEDNQVLVVVVAGWEAGGHGPGWGVRWFGSGRSGGVS